MPNTLDQNIRGALESRLSGITGLPVIAWEAKEYRPTPGTPFLEPTIVPIQSRPSTIGLGHLVKHEGRFMVQVVWPSGKGMGDAEAIANAIKSQFTASDNPGLNDTILSIQYAERRPTLHDPQWIRIPIEIGWLLFDPDY